MLDFQRPRDFLGLTQLSFMWEKSVLDQGPKPGREKTFDEDL